MKDCENCGEGYDPVATRWRCPRCGYKEHCCEGEASPRVSGKIEP